MTRPGIQHGNNEVTTVISKLESEGSRNRAGSKGPFARPSNHDPNRPSHQRTKNDQNEATRFNQRWDQKEKPDERWAKAGPVPPPPVGIRGEGREEQ